MIAEIHICISILGVGSLADLKLRLGESCCTAVGRDDGGLGVLGGSRTRPFAANLLHRFDLVRVSEIISPVPRLNFGLGCGLLAPRQRQPDADDR